MVFSASINLTHPSPQQQAALRQCRPLRCTLHPGETLLLPAYWHHEVYSRAAHAASEGGQQRAGQQPLNVAVNHWFRNESAPPPQFAS